MKLNFFAALNLKAAEAGKPRRFSILAYSGGPLNVDGFPLPVIVDLAGLDIPDTVPILVDHKNTVETTVGQTDIVENTGRELLLAGPITTEPSTPGVQNTPAQQVVARKDHKWKASIGALVITQEVIQAGQSVEVNGQRFVGPVIVARQSKLGETSVLASGADSSTEVNLAAAAAGGTANMEAWLKSLGVDIATLNDAQKAAYQQAYDAVQRAATVPVATPVVPGGAPTVTPATASAGAAINLQAGANLQAALEQQIQAARAQFAADMRRTSEIQAAAAGHPLIAAKAVQDGWTLDRVKLEVLQAQQARTRPTSFRSAEKELPTATVLEAAVCTHRRTRNVEQQYTPEILQAAHSQFRGGIGLKQLFLCAAAANGYQQAGYEGVTRGNLREILAYACPDPRSMHLQAASFSTLSLPGILSNIANKELETGYMEEDQTWREVAAIKSVNDFKTVTTYRMLDNMEYEELGPGGKIKHGSLSEETYTRQAKTYAKMYSLERTQILNDDLGAFDDLRTRVGAGSMKKFNRVFWTRWLDNAAFFTAGRGNYISGSTTTLLTDLVGLQLALDAFDAMRSPSADGSKVLGGTIGGAPSILLTPGGAISNRADVIYKNSNLGSGTANADANIFSGRYKPVKSVFLNDSTLPNYSALAWYLLRNPKVAAAVVASFLNGQEMPTVEVADADFDMLGISLRGFHDFGCDQAEPLCGVKSKGAA